jgi:hypothetical protein
MSTKIRLLSRKKLLPPANSLFFQQGEAIRMFAIAKAVLIALAVAGVAATGVAASVVDAPMQEAIDIHKEHLGQDSTMPEQSTYGQQNSLDRLMENWERWMSKPHNETDDDDDLDEIGDDEQDETDDNDLEDTDEDELDDTNESNLKDAIIGVLNWMKTAF